VFSDCCPLFSASVGPDLRGVAPIVDFAAGADLADTAPNNGAGREAVEHSFPAGERAQIGRVSRHVRIAGAGVRFGTWRGCHRLSSAGFLAGQGAIFPTHVLRNEEISPRIGIRTFLKLKSKARGCAVKKSTKLRRDPVPPFQDKLGNLFQELAKGMDGADVVIALKQAGEEIWAVGHLGDEIHTSLR
jgi:hypothetical protein